MTYFLKIASRTLFIVAFLVAGLASVGSQVFAQDSGASQEGGSGLSISPTRTEIIALPGSSHEVTVTVRNTTNTDILARPLINDFEADPQNGSAPRLLGPDEESAQSLRNFVFDLEDVRLAPDESKDVTFSVIVPEQAFPGGYFGALRFQALPVNDLGEEQPGQISLTASVASLLFVEVPGDILQDVQVDFISAYLKGNQGTLFIAKPDVIGVSVTNNGDSFIKPFGSVRLENFGNTILTYELNNQQPRGNVLPESTRVFEDRVLVQETRTANGEETSEEYNPVRWPGRYTLTADISYGSGGEIFTVSSTFWYIPSWLILTIVLLLGFLVGMAVYLYRKYHNKGVRRR